MEAVDIIDYGLIIEEGCFEANDKYASIPYDITVAYALAVLMKSSINSIYVVGFDGYAESDVRQLEMIEILNLYSNSEASVEITALTPTTYPVRKGSVYAPIS